MAQSRSSGPCLQIIGVEVGTTIFCVGNVMNYPYVTMFGEGDELQFDGAFTMIIKTFAEKYGMCLHYRLPKEFSFGIRTSNGSFNGMIGEVQRDEADMIIIPLSVSADRYEAVDFTPIISDDSHVPVIRYPNIQSDFTGFLRPFTLQAWLLIFVGLFLVSLILNVVALLDRSFNKEEGKEQKRGNFFQSGLFFGPFATIIEEVIDLGKIRNQYRNFTSPQLIFGIWLLCSLIPTAFYKSNLKAMMTAPRIRLPFYSIEGMIDQTSIPFTVIKNSYLYDVAKNSPRNTTLGRLYDRMENPSPGLQIERIIGGELALMAPYLSALERSEQVFSPEGGCKITPLNDRILEVNFAIATARRKPWKKDFDRMVTQLKEFGIVGQWVEELMTINPKCQISFNIHTQSIRPLALADFYGTFYLLVTGWTLSAVVFMVEVVFRRVKSG